MYDVFILPFANRSCTIHYIYYGDAHHMGRVYLYLMKLIKNKKRRGRERERESERVRVSNTINRVNIFYKSYNLIEFYWGSKRIFHT